MADETSHQRNNDKRWMWAALSNNVAFSKLTAEETNMLPNDYLVKRFHTFLVTDQYSAYKYIDESKRQLCWAHILRTSSLSRKAFVLKTKKTEKNSL